MVVIVTHYRFAYHSNKKGSKNAERDGEVMNRNSTDIQKLLERVGVSNSVSWPNNIEAGEGIYIKPSVIEELLSEQSEVALDDEFWREFIPIIKTESLSDRAISLLYNSKVANIEMAHKNLPDKWLEKYAIFDNAPIYKLIARYFTEECYSVEQFYIFASKYLLSNTEYYCFALEEYTCSKKWLLLVHFGLISENKEISNIAEKHLEILQIAISKDSNSIVDAYKNNKDEPLMLLAIAGNVFTPKEILLELASIKGIKNASKIREKSLDTFKIVKKILV